VFGVLIEIFRSNAVVADSSFPREGDVPLKYLMSAPADPDAGPIAVEEVSSLEGLGWSVAVKAPARPLI
jgi:hypothetical protein